MLGSHVSIASRARLLTLGVVLTGGLAACVGQDKTAIQCEPGVADLSRTVAAPPANC